MPVYYVLSVLQEICLDIHMYILGNQNCWTMESTYTARDVMVQKPVSGNLLVKVTCKAGVFKAKCHACQRKFLEDETSP